MLPQAAYQLKSTINSLLPFTADALHVHFGLFLFIVVAAPVNGLFRYHVVAQYAIFGEIWAHPQTRFIVNGQVIDEDPTPPSSLDFPSIVSPGTYMHELVFTENDSFPQTITGRVEWRVAAGGHDFEPRGGQVWIRNRRRGYSILELAK